MDWNVEDELEKRYLQVECGPDHIEEGEENKANIFEELGTPVEEKLRKFASKLLTWLDHQDVDDQFAHPEAAPNKCRDAQGSGVVAEPGKVESNFQSKVLRDLACMWTCKANIGENQV